MADFSQINEKYPFKHKGEKNPRKNILKLGRKITDCMDHKFLGVTTDDPEYWALACFVTDEMADVALKMKLRKHYTLKDLHKMNPQYDKETLKRILKDMADVGLIEYDRGDHYDKNGPIPGAPQVIEYWLPTFVPGSAEYTNMYVNMIDEHPELASFFERMTYLPLAGITQMVPEGGAGIGMHVIPVEKAIEMENRTVDIEKLSYWLKRYEGHLGVGICSCRIGQEYLDEGCGDDYYDWCIGVGDMADYCRETGKGHDITYDECMEILRRAEANGFVHQITNIDGKDRIFAICNCNVNICYALRTSQMFNTPNLSRSSFTARVEKQDCVACGKCVEYCPAGAVKLGQKLYKKDGSEVEYPKMVLPDKVLWGKDKWDIDYRDNNRINCYDTGTAPCKTACPAHIAIQGYLKMAGQGRYKEALELIKKDNPFPAVCGRICNKRCEEACTRGTIDEAVAIDAVKKYIAELDLHAETRFVPEVVIPSSRFDHWDDKIAIIGAGPAGMSCAFYLAQKGYKPTVFEKHEKPGGMLTYGIPSFKLEKDVIEAEIDIMREMGVEIKCGVEVGKDVTIQQLRDEGYKAFYVAIGCQGGKIPEIPGADAKGTNYAVRFLEGAISDENQKMSGKVVVIGGGNVAVDCVRTAKRFGAEEVSMFCLESRETMPASNDEIAETLEEGIAINNGWGPMEIMKDKKGHVKSVVFKKCVSTIDADGKFNPKYDENETMTVDADEVVFAIGQDIIWGDLLEGTKVEFWHGKYPVADSLTYQTAEPDIFVGGDVYSGPSFAINAIEAGKNAAVSLHRFVRPGTSMTIGRNRRDFVMLDKDDISIYSYDRAGRQEEPFDETIDRKTSFRDAKLTLSEAQVKIEASRCLSCGASVVDENKCIGCGVCTTKCEFDAIHLFKTHPHANDMRDCGDKFLYIGPYAAKRAAKIAFAPKNAAEKASMKASIQMAKAKILRKG